MDSLIKEYEEKAKQIELTCSEILDSATKKKEQILINAKNQAADELTKNIKILEEKKSKNYEELKHFIENKRSEMIKKIDSDLVYFEKKSNNNSKKAIEFILKKIDEKYTGN